MNQIVTASAVVAATPVAFALPSSGAATDDPIFAAIERHDRAFKAFIARCHHEDDLAEQGVKLQQAPDDSRTPEMVAAVNESIAAREALAATVPTTPVGLAKLTSYVDRFSVEAGEFLFTDHDNRAGGASTRSELFDFIRSLRMATAGMSGELKPWRPSITAEGEDPIFSAIERHRTAMVRNEMAVSQQGVLEVELPCSRRRSNCRHGDLTVYKRDDSRWVEAQREIRTASDAMEDAAIAILETEPSTYAGVVALLMYGFEQGGIAPLVPDRVAAENDIADEFRWHDLLLRHAAEALGRLANVPVPTVMLQASMRGYDPAVPGGQMQIAAE